MILDMIETYLRFHGSENGQSAFKMSVGSWVQT